jgi:uncharacterized protein (DUF4415 family)
MRQRDISTKFGGGPTGSVPSIHHLRNRRRDFGNGLKTVKGASGGEKQMHALAALAPAKRAEMKRKSTIAKYSLSEVQDLRKRGKDPARSSVPEAASLGEEFWKSARVVMPRGKTSVHLRLDSDVVDWFKARGKGHLTRMNAVLRAYVNAQERCA